MLSARNRKGSGFSLHGLGIFEIHNECKFSPGRSCCTTDFSVLQNELEGRSKTIVLVAFDLFYLSGYDLRRLPLFSRKAVQFDILAFEVTSIVKCA
jgi:hypothetical protein